MSARRRRREQQLKAMPDVAALQPEPEGDWQEILDEELSRLPEKYRAPVVLCDLEGKTRKDAARLLGWPEGTVSGRLSRARGLLARRLGRRGVALSAAALAAALTPDAASASVSLTLAESTLKAATLFAAGQATLPSAASALAEGVLKTMLLYKLKNLMIGILTVAVVLTLGSTVGHRLMADDKSSAEAKAGNLRDTILVLDQQFWEAASKHDVETLGRLFASDYFGLGTDGTRYTKPALMDQYRQFRLGERKLTSEREVVRIDEHTAILTYEVAFKILNKNGQQTEAAHRRFLSCWVQRDGGWFIKFGQETHAAHGPQQVTLNEVNYDLFQAYPQLEWANALVESLNSNQVWFDRDSTSSVLRPTAGYLYPANQTFLLQPNAPCVLTATFPQYKLLYKPFVFPLDSSAQADQTGKSLDQLMDKVLKAHGGEDALRRLSAFTLKVQETDASGRVSTITHFVQLPDHYRVEISRQGANSTEIHILGQNGMQHWRKGPDGKVEALHQFGLEPTREYWLDYLRFFGPRAVLRLKEPAYQLKRLDEIDVHFRPSVGIQLTVSAPATTGKSFVGPDRKLYFDKETGLLVKEVQDHLEMLFGAHKSMNGVTLAQKWSVRSGKEQEPTTGSVQEFKLVDNFDPVLFQKP